MARDVPLQAAVACYNEPRPRLRRGPSQNPQRRKRLMGIDTLQDLRDVTIISFTIAGTVLFLIGIILSVVIGGMTWATISKVKGGGGERVQPPPEKRAGGAADGPGRGA